MGIPGFNDKHCKNKITQVVSGGGVKEEEDGEAGSTGRRRQDGGRGGEEEEEKEIDNASLLSAELETDEGLLFNSWMASYCLQMVKEGTSGLFSPLGIH